MALKDQYSTNLGLSVQPEIDQQKHPQIFLELARMRNAFRVLQGALDAYTGALSEDPQYWNQVTPTNSTRVQNISRLYAKASETITVGQVVYFWNNAGVLNARKADANAIGNTARGFCAVTAGVVAGDMGEFILLGVNPYYAGLTPGTTYYLANTPGLISAVPGTVSQVVGWAIDANNLWFAPALQ